MSPPRKKQKQADSDSQEDQQVSCEETNDTTSGRAEYDGDSEQSDESISPEIDQVLNDTVVEYVEVSLNSGSDTEIMPESNEDVVLERVQDHLHEILSNTSSFTRDVADLKLDSTGFHDCAKSHITDVMNASSSAVCEDMFQTFHGARPIAERDKNNQSHSQQEKNSLVEGNETILKSNSSSQGIIIQQTKLSSANIKHVTFSHIDCRLEHETSLEGKNEMSLESVMNFTTTNKSDDILNEETNSNSGCKPIVPTVLAHLEDDSMQEESQNSKCFHETSLEGENEMSLEFVIDSETERRTNDILNEKINQTDEVTNFNSSCMKERIELHLQDKSDLSMENASQLNYLVPTVLAHLEDYSLKEESQNSKCFHETSLEGGNELSSEFVIGSETERRTNDILNEEINQTDEVTNFNSSCMKERIELHLQDKSDLSMENASQLNYLVPTVLTHLADDSVPDGRQDSASNIDGDALEGQCSGNTLALLCNTYEGAVPMFEVMSSTPKKITDTPGTILIPLSPINAENSLDRSIQSCHTSEGDDQDNCDISYASSALYSTLNSNSSSSNISVILDEANIQQQSRTMDVFQKFIGLNTIKLHSNTDHSVTESILGIMKTFLKNHDSKATLSRNVKTIAKLLPSDHHLPSGKTILNYVKGLIPSVPEEKHYYCKQCVIYREKSDIDNQCCVCLKLTDVGQFYQFSVAGIVKYLFENRNLANIMDSAAASRENVQSNIYKDVQSGSEYKRINRDRGRYDLTMILNSDGVQLKKKSCAELWLLLCTFVEIPNHLREAFLCVLGVWYDQVKPNMNTFMKPFCEEMVKISKEGNEWKHPVTGEIHKSFVRLQLVVADAPARAKMQNILLHNGRYGCSICEIKTVKCTLQEGMKKRIRVYPYVHSLTLRSEERMVTQAERALKTGSCVKGVKGASVLSTIPLVDISSLFIPEYMHSTLLGVTRQVLDILLNKSGPWNLKKYSLSIDEDLAGIRPPDFVHRFPRQVQNLKNWKASDFYYFLLFEALPTLKLYLSFKYYQHFILLVDAIFKLLRRDITEDDIVKADLLLNFFVNQFGDLYSDRELSSNIHNLCHLALCVKRHGPLSCTSAFPFEGMNGIIAKSTHGTLNVGQEIVNNIQICQGVQILEKIVKGVDGFSLERPHQSFSSGEPLGQEAELRLSPEEISLFKGREFHIYSRAKFGCESFTSEIHKKLKSANFYVIWKERCDDSNVKQHVGTVKYFAVVDSELHVCLKFWKVDHLNVIFHEETMTTVDHLIPVLETNKICLVSTSDLTLFEKVGKCSNFVFRRPNLLHQVM